MALRSFDDGDSDEARQFLLDRKCERLHPKRHRTMKRAKGLSAKKKARVKSYLEQSLARVRKHKAQAAAYWRGECDHP